MLYYDRIDISERIDLTKNNKSKEWMICHYWFFKNGLKCQNSVRSVCHDLTMISVIISDITIINVKNFIVFVLFIKLANLKELIYLKNLLLRIVVIYSRQFFFYFFCFVIYKMVDSKYSTDIYKSINSNEKYRNA